MNWRWWLNIRFVGVWSCRPSKITYIEGFHSREFMLKSRCLSWCYINSKLEHYCFIFDMCIVYRFFKHSVFGTAFFLCHLAWGRLEFYRLRLCGNIFSWSPNCLVFKLTGMFIALVVFSLPLSHWQCKYYVSFSKYVYSSIYKWKHLCHIKIKWWYIKIKWWWCVHVGLHWQYYYCHIVVEVDRFLVKLQNIKFCESPLYNFQVISCM